MDGRTALKRGTILPFPGMRCTLQEEIGRGSNALVYRGWYEDSLTAGGRHHILVKELFPLHPRGLIRRREDDALIVEEDAASFWELHLKSFERGNSAHLTVLENSPGEVGGNINSFALNGTHYTVLDYTGGRSLEEAVAAQPAMPLRTTAVRIRGLLQALEAFHRQQLVHLDVSPDNALLIGQDDRERVMLIDYNSAHTLEELRSGMTVYQSVKPGFTAPEVRVPTGRTAGFPADLFSVAAVMYYCLTGRALTPFELTRKEPPDVSGCEALRDAPDPVIRMVRTMLRRGLAVVPEKRYQTIAQMQTDLQELLDRIDGVGITHWALWEAGRQQVAGMIRANPAMDYIRQEEKLYPARVYMQDGSMLPMDEAVEQLLAPCGQSAMLLGHGGVGKTTALLNTACRLGKRYSPAQSAVMYISLYGWTAGDPHYVTDHILEYMRFRTDHQRLADARHALRALMEQPLKTRTGEKPVLLLLIDGLNETPADNEPLLRELHELAALPGVRLLVASRTESAGLTLAHMELSKLTDRDVARALSEAALAMPENDEMQQLLRTPLMLSIFISAASGSGRQLMLSGADELLQAYFRALQEKEERDQPDNAARRWQTAAALELVLPAVAAECARRKKALTAAELLETVTRCRSLLRPGWLKRLFPGWVGHSQEILGETKTAEEWLGLMVQQLLWQHLGLLLQDAQGAFRPSHQELAEYLERQHAQRQKAVRARKLRRYAAAGLAAALLVSLLIVGWQQLETQRREELRLEAQRLAEEAAKPRPAYDEKTAISVYEAIETTYLDCEDLVLLMQEILQNVEAAGNVPSSKEMERQRALLDLSLESGSDTTFQMLMLGMLTNPELPWLEVDPDELETMNESFSTMALKGAYNETDYVISWSQKPLDVKACVELFQFGQRIQADYGLFLDVLHYAASDELAIRNGYFDTFLGYVRQIVEADAKYLVYLYHQACDPHLRTEWVELRNPDNSLGNYALYYQHMANLPQSTELFTAELTSARSIRDKITLEIDYMSVMTGYKSWQKASQSPQMKALIREREEISLKLSQLDEDIAALAQLEKEMAIMQGSIAASVKASAGSETAVYDVLHERDTDMQSIVEAFDGLTLFEDDELQYPSVTEL